MAYNLLIYQLSDQSNNFSNLCTFLLIKKMKFLRSSYNQLDSEFWADYNELYIKI